MVFFVLSIKSPHGRKRHWTLRGCNVDNPCIRYYDCGKRNLDRRVYVLAMQRFMELLAASDANDDPIVSHMGHPP